mgnify:CR=1 FL=1
MKYILTTAATIAAIASASFADAPAGASAAPCDATQFTPVMSADGTRVLYWNNPTCKNPSPIEECKRDNSCDDDL